MGKDDSEEMTEEPYDVAGFDNSNPASDENQCSTTKIVKSQCRIEEVEPGKFARKCVKTHQILRDCVGRPTEVVQSNKEYTEEDVTEQVKSGSFPLELSELGPFDFPGLGRDIEAIERSLMSGLSRFFEAAEEMKNGFFSIFGSPDLYDEDSSSSSTRRQEIPIEDDPPPKLNDSEYEHVEFSGLAKDV